MAYMSNPLLILQLPTMIYQDHENWSSFACSSSSCWSSHAISFMSPLSGKQFIVTKSWQSWLRHVMEMWDEQHAGFGVYCFYSKTSKSFVFLLEICLFDSTNAMFCWEQCQCSHLVSESPRWISSRLSMTWLSWRAQGEHVQLWGLIYWGKRAKTSPRHKCPR